MMPIRSLLLLLALAPLALAQTAENPKPHAEKAARPTQNDAATPQSTDAATSDKLKQIERAWADAEVKHDPSLVAPYLASTLVKTGDDNKPLTRDQLLDHIKNSETTIGSIDVSDMQVQVYGNAAIVTGAFKAVGQDKGQNFTNTGRFTDTFVQKDGRWQAVASHDSLDAAK
jgi:ketosteroid isomerase-like protein